MNLKNNYLFKKNSWSVTKHKNFNIYNVVFFNKIKKNTCRHHYFTPGYQKSWWYDLQFLKYGAWQTEISNCGSFLALLPLNPSPPKKNRILNKWKKLLEISLFYTCVPKIMIIWCTVPEIHCGTDRIFCHFGPFFTLLLS